MVASLVATRAFHYEGNHHYARTRPGRSPRRSVEASRVSEEVQLEAREEPALAVDQLLHGHAVGVEEARPLLPLVR
jgi:hypothetical protein